MKISFQEVLDVCEEVDGFTDFLERKGIDPQAFAACGNLSEEIEITIEEAKQIGIFGK